MRAALFREFGGPEVLRVTEMPTPEAREGEVRVRVRAAGVNPVDWKIREGKLEGMFPHEFPVVLGWDVAGVIDQVGLGVTDWEEGEEVYAYCRKETVRDGSFAEAITLPASYLARKPHCLDFVRAGALPLVSLTAWQSLDAADLGEEQTILVHGAAGGVGSAAVQLAKLRGATVLGTASAPKHDFLRELGVDHPIDYREADLREAVRDRCPEGVDVVLDLVGGDTLATSREVVSEQGKVVTLVDPEGVEALRDQGVDAAWAFVTPDAPKLDALRDLVESRRFGIPIERAYPLDEVSTALEVSRDGHVTGKLVIEVG